MCVRVCLCACVRARTHTPPLSPRASLTPACSDRFQQPDSVFAVTQPFPPRHPLPRRQARSLSVCVGVCFGRVLGYPTSAQLHTRLAPSAARCCSRRRPGGAAGRASPGSRRYPAALSATPTHQLTPCAALQTAAPVLLAIWERINSKIDWLSCTWRGTEGDQWSATACLPPGRRK